MKMEEMHNVKVYRSFYAGVWIAAAALLWLVSNLRSEIESHGDSIPMFQWIMVSQRLLGTFILLQMSFAAERILCSFIPRPTTGSPGNTSRGGFGKIPPEFYLILGDFRRSVFSKKSVFLLVCVCWSMMAFTWYNNRDNPAELNKKLIPVMWVFGGLSFIHQILRL